MTGEWIGLIGGLAGTVLGWMLGILSQKGRLHIFSEWSDRFQQDDAVGGIIYSTTRDNAKYYRYSLVLDLYNASGEPKVMRKIEIVFYKGRRELFRLVPKDDSTKRYTAACYMYDDIQPITVPAKSVLRLNLHGGINQSESTFPRIWDSQKIKLSYCKKSKREKHILIRKENYANYFEKHLPESSSE